MAEESNGSNGLAVNLTQACMRVAEGGALKMSVSLKRYEYHISSMNLASPHTMAFINVACCVTRLLSSGILVVSSENHLRSNISC